MNKIISLLFTAFAMLTLTACGGDKGGDAKTPEQLIVGTWVSSEPLGMDEGGVTVTITDMTAIYKKDNTSEFSMNMAMSGAMLPQKMELDMTGAGVWSVEGTTLTETVKSVDAKMKTEIPGMPDLSPMIAEELKNKGAVTSTIITLDKNSLVLKDNDTGETMKLKRK